MYTCGKLRATICYALIDGKATRVARLLTRPFTTHHLPSTCCLLTADRPSLLGPISLVPDMSQSSSGSSSTFQALFGGALRDYEDIIGSRLSDHPLAKELQECDSVGSITAILKEQAQIFREFRDHGKLVNSLKHLVDILSSPYISNVFDQGDLVVRQKASLGVSCC
jgi:hypothetical protein